MRDSRARHDAGRRGERAHRSPVPSTVVPDTDREAPMGAGGVRHVHICMSPCPRDIVPAPASTQQHCPAEATGVCFPHRPWRRWRAPSPALRSRDRVPSGVEHALGQWAVPRRRHGPPAQRIMRTHGGIVHGTGSASLHADRAVPTGSGAPPSGRRIRARPAPLPGRVRTSITDPVRLRPAGPVARPPACRPRGYRPNRGARGMSISTCLRAPAAMRG